MEKMSRMKKYKDLRDQINEEVTIDREKPVVEETIEEDDFLKEIKPRSYQDVVVNTDTDGTLDGIAFEQLLSKDKDVDKALSRAKAYGGREYDTRMDIYNRIRKTAKEDVKNVVKEDVVKEAVKEEIKEDVKEEIKEETKVPEVIEEKEPVQEEVLIQEEIPEENVENNEDVLEEEKEEKKKTPLGIKILNGIIIILVLVVIALFAYLVSMFM